MSQPIRRALFIAAVALSTSAHADGPADAIWMRGGHAGGGASATWSPDGSQFATAGDDKTIKIWSGTTGMLVRTMHGHGGGYGPGVEWSPQGDRLVSYSWDRTVRVWDAADGAQLWSIDAGTQMNVATFSPDGTIVASGGFDDVVTVRTVETGALVTTLTGFPDRINDAGFSPDGARLAVLSADRAIRIWSTDDWTLLRTISNTHDFFAVSVAFSPEGDVVGSAGGLDAPAIRLWNPDTGALVRTLSMGGGSGPAVGIDFSRDGRYVGAGRNTGARVFSRLDDTLVSHVPAAGSVAFDPPGSTFLGIHFTNGDPFPVARFDVETGAVVDRFMSHSSPGAAVAFSFDGSVLASAASAFDSSIQIWDAATGARQRTLAYTINSDGLSSVAFSPDSALIAGGGGDWDQSTQVWRVSDGERLLVLPQGPNRIPGLDFSPDGSLLATGSDSGSLALWQIPSGSPHYSITVGSVRSLQWAHGEKELIAVGTASGAIQLVDPGSGDIVQTIGADTGTVDAVEFNSDGTLLLSGGSDGLLKLWTVPDGALVRTFLGHTGAVGGVDMSPGGGMIVSGAHDGTVRLWDALTAEPLETYTEETGIAGFGVVGVAFAPDEQTFAYMRADSSVVMARVPGAAVIGDLDGDGVVDFGDLLVLLSAWGPCAAPCPPACTADLDGDCDVDFADLLVVISNWGS